MELYHGTIYAFEIPELEIASRNKSFGPGFYATTFYRQAEDWAKLKMKTQEKEKAYINVYNLENIPNDIKFKKFETIEEWFDFVCNNRYNDNFKHDNDIVYGKVADNELHETLTLYKGGLLNKEEAIKKITAREDLVDQFSFNTKRAIKLLKFLKRITINL